MGFFKDPAEVDRYIGGILRLAASNDEVGSKLEASSTTLRLMCYDPDCELTASLDSPIRIDFGPSEVVPDVTLLLGADVLDGFWRGQYSILDGLARGEIRAKGPISRILKLLPVMDPLFPRYRALVAAKDAVCRPGNPSGRGPASDLSASPRTNQAAL